MGQLFSVALGRLSMGGIEVQVLEGLRMDRVPLLSFYTC